MTPKTIKIISFAIVVFALGWFANLFFDNYLFDKAKKETKIIADTLARQMNQVNEDLISNLKHGKNFDLYLNWKTVHSDTSSYSCELEIRNDFLIHWFHGQCAYYFFTYQTSDSTMDMLWSYKTDCLLNMDFLEKPQGEKEFPKKGDVFATYTRRNDTTLTVNYYFPKWTRKINEIAKDSLFARCYYMK